MYDVRVTQVDNSAGTNVQPNTLIFVIFEVHVGSEWKAGSYVFS